MGALTAEKYSLHIEPDLNDFTFSGLAQIQLHASEPVIEISLHAKDLSVQGCSVLKNNKKVECSFRTASETEELIISLPDEISGAVHLKIIYSGEINNRMAGFYRSGYGPDDHRQYIAVTQFQESDARRAFPCLDHPREKAIFEIEMIIDNGVVAISNTPAAEEKNLENGKKYIRFDPSPKMSTYLVFFGVGDFRIKQDKDDPRVRMVSLPGRERFGNFGLDFGRKSLRFCEDYFAVPYPLPKLDLIAVPDFAFGAMENWGAITFRENLLLHYPGKTSKSGKERICEVIAHEIVHQWFGNLVTPSDWQYLWLNESFATYFGFGVVDYYHPEWDIWDQFVNTQTRTAMDRDALHETFSIEIPGGDHVVINAATAPIIYNKGGSILRQIEGYIGAGNFKKGLRKYLKTHEYGCAASHHLWEAFESASEKPITQMVKSWIEQPGYPILEVERNDEHLVITQNRFTLLPNAMKQTWSIPLSIRLFESSGKSQLVSSLLEDKTTKVRVGNKAAAYKVNEGQTGFYRVKYSDRDCLKDLGSRVLNKELPPVDRWGLENDFFALVQRGDYSLDDYFGFLKNYMEEDAYLPLSSIAGNLYHAYLVVDRQGKEKIADFGKPLFEKVLKAVGLEPHPDERHTTSVLRDNLIWHAVVYGSDNTGDFVKEKFERLRSGENVHPDIQKGVMQAGAFLEDMDTLNWMVNRFKGSESEHERMNVLIAMGCHSKMDTMKKALRFVLDNVPDRNKFIPIVSAGVNPNISPYLWNWYLANLDELEGFHPLLYERVISSIVPIGGLEDPDGVKDFFNDYLKKNTVPKDAIKMSLERLEINRLMKLNMD
ncbi:MAG TPA: M1 family metallopeptidase [Deltaproteobacteria bacterium]|nr:M1 family metallopeptidase [Deltaproteobacteria bacterium]